MPEFLKLLSPDDARNLLLANIAAPLPDSEIVPTQQALGRVAAEDVSAPHALPEFDRSSMDGYAVRARDTFGANESLPAYLTLVGEVPMGGAPCFTLRTGECALIHTGGMLPAGSDAVVMLEHSQVTPGVGDPSHTEIEILRAVAPGENLIRIGEDVREGQSVLAKGTLLRPAEIGGLEAFGIQELRVTRKVRVGLISTGDEVVQSTQRPARGQVRDINSHTLAALVERTGGEAIPYGIVPDQPGLLETMAARALAECDVLVITAGSSASARDVTAQVISGLGEPGVLVHGINTRPGKPTILGACRGKAAIGLPGNPVSCLVNGYLLLIPVIEALLGLAPRIRPSVAARLTVNLSSQAGREDWWPVRLEPLGAMPGSQGVGTSGDWQAGHRDQRFLAEPIFSKSNLIFSLVSADGLLKIPADATGLAAGEAVEVFLL
jgi:molybdopterin molybdotransferase